MRFIVISPGYSYPSIFMCENIFVLALTIIELLTGN